MTLASRQIIKELNRITEKKLKSGFVPAVELIRSELIKFYKKVTVGSPSFKARQQSYRRVWDIDIYNDNLEEIYNDLNSLYEEIVNNSQLF